MWNTTGEENTDVQVLYNQQELIYNSFVQTHDVV